MTADKTVTSNTADAEFPDDMGLVPCLVVLSGAEQGAVFPLREGDTVVGRSDQAQIVLSESGISRRHATFSVTKMGIFVEDLDSTNGVSVNGERVEQRQLQPGDTISLCKETILRLSLQDDKVSELLSELYQEASLDSSGVLTRKNFFSRLKTGSEFSLAVIELDLFQQLRDRFGHQLSEDLVGQVADVLKNGLAGKGIVARLSGEGFLVNLFCRALDADVVLEGVRKGIEFSNFRIATREGIDFVRLTVSIGIAAVVDEDDVEESLSAAEEALGLAKQMGRNRMQLSERKKFGR